MKQPDVLVINTYGGSLLLGATAAGLKIRGSYEDCGFGSDIQALNFPDVPLVRDILYWPEQDLSNTIVIAHPPCSAFSTMNSSPVAKATRGIGSDAFACTQKVLRYAMNNGAKAIAIESVVGAYQGAAQVHEDFAKKHGYGLYRVLQNSITLGVPQWRNRFWAIFVKDGDGEMSFTMNPMFKSLRDVLEGEDPGDPIEMNMRFWLEQVAYFRGSERTIRTHTPRPKQIQLDETLTPTQIKKLLNGELGFGTVPGIAAKLLAPKMKKLSWKKFDRNHGGFTCQWMNVLNPDLYAPVLLGAAWWACCGRVLGEDDYKRIMGFPAKYKFPEGTLKKNMRMYLSKGVVPAVATWVLQQITQNLIGLNIPGRINITIKPGETADFRISKKDWRNLDVQPRNG